jgi:general secretion pathway protein A
MHLGFYSLTTAPFTKESDSRHLFISPALSEGSARLEYLKTARGIGLVTGEAGSGKTSLLRRFAQSLNPSLSKAIYFPLSTLTVMDFYRGLAACLGEEPKFRKVDLFAQIQTAILTLFQNKRITPVLILDEMHMASNAFLNDISLLFNFAMDSENPFVLVLSGLPHLADRLKLVHNQPLMQRIILRYHVQPLGKEDVRLYLEHHLKRAGAGYEIFTPQAVEAIASRSRGLPRIINNLATHSLLYGYAKQLRTIDEETVFAITPEAGA